MDAPDHIRAAVEDGDKAYAARLFDEYRHLLTGSERAELLESIRNMPAQRSESLL